MVVKIYYHYVGYDYVLSFFVVFDALFITLEHYTHLLLIGFHEYIYNEYE